MKARSSSSPASLSEPAEDSAPAAAAYDRQLVIRFNAGDESAFNEIVDRYHARVFSLAQNVLRNRADAEEIAQDTFVRAYRALPKFRGDSSLATWLYRIAMNLSRNRYWYFRRRRRHDAVSLEHEWGEEKGTSFANFIAEETAGPRRDATQNEFQALVEKCMSALDPNYREILSLRNGLDLPYEEIARLLDLKVGTVKSRIARARDTLRRLIASEAPDFGPAADPTDYFESVRSVPGCHAIAYA